MGMAGQLALAARLADSELASTPLLDNLVSSANINIMMQGSPEEEEGLLVPNRVPSPPTFFNGQSEQPAATTQEDPFSSDEESSIPTLLLTTGSEYSESDYGDDDDACSTSSGSYGFDIQEAILAELMGISLGPPTEPMTPIEGEAPAVQPPELTAQAPPLEPANMARTGLKASPTDQAAASTSHAHMLTAVPTMQKTADHNAPQPIPSLHATDPTVWTNLVDLPCKEHSHRVEAEKLPMARLGLRAAPTASTKPITGHVVYGRHLVLPSEQLGTPAQSAAADAQTWRQQRPKEQQPTLHKPQPRSEPLTPERNTAAWTAAAMSF